MTTLTSIFCQKESYNSKVLVYLLIHTVLVFTNWCRISISQWITWCCIHGASLLGSSLLPDSELLSYFQVRVDWVLNMHSISTPSLVFYSYSSCTFFQLSSLFLCHGHVVNVWWMENRKIKNDSISSNGTWAGHKKAFHTRDSHLIWQAAGFILTTWYRLQIYM